MYEVQYSPLNGECVGVVRVSDGAVIPRDPQNRDWQEFLAWNDAQTQPVDLSDRPPTAEELRASMRTAGKAAFNADDPASVRLRGVLKLLLQVIAQDRLYLAAIRQELVALGRSPAAAPGVRNWAQLKAGVAALIDAGEGDPDTQ